MKRYMPLRLLLAAIMLLLLTVSAQAQTTFTVTNTLNAGAGSLNQAILDSNAAPPPAGFTNTINFAIPGAGPHTIAPAAALPQITAAVDIDATTQPGYVPNSLDIGDNEVPQIILNGGGAVLTGFFFGLGSAGSSVKGMVINGFTTGILVGDDNITIQANFIGTDVTGTVAVPNITGIQVVTSGGHLIGGDFPEDRNLISGNTVVGIQLLTGSAAGGSEIYNNYMGTNAAGTAALAASVYNIEIRTSGNQVGSAGDEPLEVFHPGNLISGASLAGVHLTTAGATGNDIEVNLIGTDAMGLLPIPNTTGVLVDLSANGNLIGSDNLIAFNTNAGIEINGAATINNTITQNSIFSNAVIGIDLVAAGNLDLPSPVLTSATHSCTLPQTVITGSLTVPTQPSTVFTIEFFANSICGPPAGSGQGEIYIGSTTVTTNAAGLATFTANLPDVASNQFITATATDPAGNTSEFSNCVKIPPLANISITKTPIPCKVPVGTNVTFLLKVTNSGPETANNVVVTDNLPVGLTYAYCNATDAGVCVAVGNNVTVTFPTIPANKSEYVAIVATVAAGLPDNSAICNTATVTGDYTDCQPGDTTATICFKVLNPCADPAVASLTAELVSGNPIPLRGTTNTWVYRITITSCRVRLYYVNVVGNAPGLVSAVPSAGTVKISGQSFNPTLTWSLPTLAPTASATLLVTVRGTVPANAICGSLLELTAPWNGTFYANATYQSVGPSYPVDVTVTCL